MDRTPAPVDNNPTNNSVEAYTRLLTVPAMTAYTADREAVHAGDAHEYALLLAAVEGALGAQVVPGDGRWSASLRTRRVAKPLRKIVKHARGQADGFSELRKVFAAHVHHVTALPGQRQAKAARSAERRATIGAAASKALHKSATAAAPAPAVDAPAADQQGAQVRGITELWDRRRGA
ncbi:hypothetical protein AB0O22_12750 [Streptomyces sp. NPDC091204]|uniref:hypothetical protein n=1 Tax=Streptomyces sp. NPDC091204 TaxID=3155299 RepID=UPI00343610E5